jgi:DNA-binding LacI/PurR family transcriptional regulator
MCRRGSAIEERKSMTEDKGRTFDKVRSVSAQHVARQAGVSRSAVSRAFTPGASIATEMREKIMCAAEDLGYQVNDLARGLLANQSRLIGLVVTSRKSVSGRISPPL